MRLNLEIMSKLKFLIIFFFLIFVPLNAMAEEISFSEAENFFKEYIKLGHEYDKKVIKMYSDDALITKKVIYSNSKTEKMIIPAKNYKKKLSFFRLGAKLTGYKNKFINIKYSQEGENIRVNATRKVSDKTMPITFLLQKREDGKIYIIEEATNTYNVKLIKLINTF